jgi:hypothetical protein
MSISDTQDPASSAVPTDIENLEQDAIENTEEDASSTPSEVALRISLLGKLVIPPTLRE